MASVSEFMQHQHKSCDESFSRVEQLIDKDQWQQAEQAWESFKSEFNDHITVKEEQTLFPALEAITGPIGPVMVMKSEHEQMRALVQQIDQSIQNRDTDAFFGQSETLMILIQQHNMKEEQILYPLIDAQIPDAESLVS